MRLFSMAGVWRSACPTAPATGAGSGGGIRCGVITGYVDRCRASPASQSGVYQICSRSAQRPRGWLWIRDPVEMMRWWAGAADCDWSGQHGQFSLGHPIDCTEVSLADLGQADEAGRPKGRLGRSMYRWWPEDGDGGRRLL